MKLQSRLTALVSFLILVVAISIGIFAIKTTEKIQYQRLDDRLSAAVSQISETKDDPLSLASLLADESSLKFSVAYLSAERDLTTINESPADLMKAPTEPELKTALTKSINVNQKLSPRVRAIALPDDQFIVLSIATNEISEGTNQIIKYLLIFTLIMVVISILFSFLLFRKDNELNKMVTTLKNNQERMQLFIGDASHELRTPLTVIKGYFELIQKKLSSNQPLQPEHFDRINNEVERMTSIISDLLYIAELDQQQSEPVSQINISDLISKQIADLKALHPKRELTIDIEDGLVIQSNSKNLDQIFGNIFANLKNHTPDNSAVEIKLWRESGNVEFTIEDSGPGLPKEFYAEGIQAFQRFDSSRSRQTGGSGLGMTIISKSIEKIGGKIKLSPSSAGGLKIQISI